MDDSSTDSETASSSSSEAPSAPASPKPQTAPSFESMEPFPFLRLPPELRLMVYRQLLVGKRRIYLDYFLPLRDEVQTFSQLFPNICTSILRVFRQISLETLPILYGENTFSFLSLGSYPSVVEQFFSVANRLRLRKLVILHRCSKYLIDHDDPYSDGFNDSGKYDYRKIVPIEGQMVSPLPASFDSDIWQPIFAKLNSLTLMLTVLCSMGDSGSRDEIISQDRDQNRRSSAIIENAMGYYKSHLPEWLPIRRQVGCCLREQHYEYEDGCEEEECARLQKYVERLWLGDF